MTNHESADCGSPFEPLVVVAVSHRFLCFQVCFSCAHEGCLVLSLYTAFLSDLATRCLPVLFECITKQDMDRVWKISFSSGSFSFCLVSSRDVLQYILLHAQRYDNSFTFQQHTIFD